MGFYLGRVTVEVTTVGAAWLATQASSTSRQNREASAGVCFCPSLRGVPGTGSSWEGAALS